MILSQVAAYMAVPGCKAENGGSHTAYGIQDLNTERWSRLGSTDLGDNTILAIEQGKKL